MPDTPPNAGELPLIELVPVLVEPPPRSSAREIFRAAPSAHLFVREVVAD
jgi:hypothetical protein